VKAQAVCRLGYRAARMVAIARAVDGGRVDLEPLRDPELPEETALEQLRALPGVGPYAAGHVLSLLGPHHMLAVDSWMRDTVRRGWFGGQPVPDREIAAAFEPFRPYRNLVYRFYDWDGALRKEVWQPTS